MQLQKLSVLATLFSYVFAFPHLANYSKHRSLAGLSPQETEYVKRSFGSLAGPQPLPPPINDTSSKLVNDADHPFQPLRPGDTRGPCPGLNTLASHGYINRTGVATPGEIITAAQEGFNMGYQFASFLTYGAFIVDGNHLTNTMSIGSNVTIDSYVTPGLDIHGNFEGDVSITRSDASLGDAINFNWPLFGGLAETAGLFGDGVITLEAAAYDRRLRALDSIARNPVLAYETPRFVGAAAETGFMLAMFAHNQTSDTTKPVTLYEALNFFALHRFPDGFYRRQDPYEFPKVVALTNEVIGLSGLQPGHNEGAGNYIVNDEDTMDFCLLYQKQTMQISTLYPNPTADLKAAINANLQTYYEALGNSSCPQVFPLGM